jgi:hypothetical protein
MTRAPHSPSKAAPLEEWFVGPSRGGAIRAYHTACKTGAQHTPTVDKILGEYECRNCSKAAPQEIIDVILLGKLDTKGLGHG